MLDNRDSKELEKEFYSKKFYFSYSGLNRLLYSPKLFYNHYILQQREEKLDQHLIEGKVIHCLLLDNGSFESQFIISPANLPSGNTKLVLDKIAYGINPPLLDLENYENAILNVLKGMNLHQKLKTDAQRLEKIITEETKSYWSYLREKGSRDLLDQETYDRCLASVMILRDDTKVSDLLKLKVSDSAYIMNEVLLSIDLEEYPFGLKGILDNIVIDKPNKTIYINDLKTSGKRLSEFPETVEYYKYWMQGAIYQKMVEIIYKDLIGQGYKVRLAFIVIDKHLQVYPFEVSENTLTEWKSRLAEILTIADYHYKEKEYALPYEFATGKVTL